MDGTIVESNFKEDEKYFFLSLEFQKKKYPEYKYFKKYRKHFHTWILTTRHPILAEQIKKKFKVEKVICRDYSLGLLDMYKVVHSEEKTKEFLGKMVQYKSQKIYEAFSQGFNKVFFFDDAIMDFTHLHKECTGLLPSYIKYIWNIAKKWPSD